MILLVLNCGSSSIKYQLLDMEHTAQVLAQGGIEKIGMDDSFLLIKNPKNGSKTKIQHLIPEHTVGIELILQTLTDKTHGCLKALNEIDAVGHRVVHGGETFAHSVIITPQVREEIVKCADLAPLHNPANIKGIDAITQVLPKVPQVAVFDTAFHQTMPDYAYMYALPHELYKKYAIRRYGFHGTSHRYVSQRVCEFLERDIKSQRIIVAHIGNGGSLCAIQEGQSVDTTMGLTPVEGLMMGTRSGDLDLGAATFIMDHMGLSTAEFNTLVNKQSGLLGVSGISSDMRDIVANAEKGNKLAKLALHMFAYRCAKYIGAFIAAMNGMDILAFTGGIGEHEAIVRELICLHLRFLGCEMDNKANWDCNGDEAIISIQGPEYDCKPVICVIPTNEELMIARDTQALVK